MAEPRYIKAGVSPKGWSRYGTASTCMRRYGYRWGNPGADGPTDMSEGRAYGIVGHAALCHYYARVGARQGGVIADGIEHTDPDEIMRVRPAMEIAADELRPAFNVDVEALFKVVKAYTEFYVRDPWRVRFVEEVFTTTFQGPDGPVVYTGRADVGVEMGGFTFIGDHKFLSTPRKSEAEGFAMSGQFVGWRYMGQERYGEKFGGVILNIIDRQTCKFFRPAMPPAPDLVRSFPTTIIELDRRIRALEGKPVSAYPPVMDNDVCTHGRYGKCVFSGQCRGLW